MELREILSDLNTTRGSRKEFAEFCVVDFLIQHILNKQNLKAISITGFGGQY